MKSRPVFLWALLLAALLPLNAQQPLETNAPSFAIPVKFKVVDFDPATQLLILEPEKKVLLAVRFLPQSGQSQWPKALLTIGDTKKFDVWLQHVAVGTVGGKVTKVSRTVITLEYEHFALEQVRFVPVGGRRDTSAIHSWRDKK